MSPKGAKGHGSSDKDAGNAAVAERLRRAEKDHQEYADPQADTAAAQAAGGEARKQVESRLRPT